MDNRQSDIQGLISAYVMDGRGGGQKVNWEDVEGWRPEAGILWLHLEGDSPITEQWLRDKSGLDEIVCDVLIREAVRPRSIQLDDGLLTVLRGINFNRKEDPEDMVSVRVYLDSHRIITTRLRTVRSIVDIQKALDAAQGPTSSGDFLATLGRRLVERLSDTIESITTEVDELEELVVEQQQYTVGARLSVVRRRIIALRRHLAPQREALARVASMQFSFLTEEERHQLNDLADQTLQYLEELASARDRASVTLEELNHHSSKQVERRMYMLAVVAGIFLPLTFLTGLLGTNVGGIPGGQSTWGFLIVSVIMAAILAVQIIVFRKLRWL
ncbi:MAG: zinc transporter ZntB [Fidelibacterota bacterium]|nr:MAG: zinc transporter ZntB [Candidatus Neomarinimicrobiota bacterium]